MSTQKLFPEGLLGRKLGMTQVFMKDGACVPVTVIEVGPCVVLEVKKTDTHGYSAVQLGFVNKKAQRVNKADTGHFSKSGKGGFQHVREMRCDVEKLGWVNLGQELKAGDVFKEGELVDVSGVSIGRGFQGVVKRHHMKGQPSTRGTHEYRRHCGSVGMRKTPGRVLKGKRMPGQMGNANCTIQNLEVVGVKPEANLILVKGGVPGFEGAVVEIRKAMKGYKSSAAKAA